MKKRRLKPRIIFDFPPKKILHNTLVQKYSNKVIFSDKDNSSKNKIIENIREINETKNFEKIIFDKLPIKTDDKLDHYELNNLDYLSAIKFDNRTFFEIYWSILSREHLILFTFFNRNDHNIIYIKYSRLIFFICTDMALNVFFFSDETMHKMFVDYGKYNFVQQIPQIVYSTIVSQIIQIFIGFLSLTDKHYYQIKNLEIKTMEQISRIIKCIQLKIYFYFISTGIIFFFYWYIITCFCEVYTNTQSAFFKDSFLSFGLGLLYPFGLYLLPTILRIFSLKYFIGKLSFIYRISDMIPCC